VQHSQSDLHLVKKQLEGQLRAEHSRREESVRC